MVGLVCGVSGIGLFAVRLCRFAVAFFLLLCRRSTSSGQSNIFSFRNSWVNIHKMSTSSLRNCRVIFRVWFELIISSPLVLESWHVYAATICQMKENRFTRNRKSHTQTLLYSVGLRQIRISLPFCVIQIRLHHKSNFHSLLFIPPSNN